MTDDERRRYELLILDHHAAALKSTREMSQGLARLRAHLDAIADEMEESNRARDKAIDEMLAANEAALKLYNDEQRG